MSEAVCAPAYSSVPERAGSYLRAVEGVAAKIGRTLDPTQRLAVDVLTSAKADGAPASLAAAVICPRQNLKTFTLELITLTRLLRPGGDKLAVWSAHEVSTAQETFLKFVELYEAEDEAGRPLYPWFRRQVKSISRATGRESITFHRRLPSGRKETCRLKFKARIKTGGRGLAGDLVILDEAFALEPSHMGSLLPILSTKAKGQVIYGSSAPHASSMVLRDVIRRGRAGLMAYLEWCAPGSLAEPGCGLRGCSHQPGTPGCALDDLSLAVGCNPAAFHGRISREYLANERQELAAIPEEYARERLGWAETVGADAPISPVAWGTCKVPEPPEGEALPDQIVGRSVLAVDIAPDRGSACIAAAGFNAAGVPHVEIAQYGQGTGWVVDELVRMSAQHSPEAICLDPAGPAGSLLPDLEDAGLQPVLVTARQFGQACGGFHDAVNEGRLTHLDDEVLSVALQSATKRPLGDAWAWNRRRGGADICPLVAVTLAWWLHATQGSRPGGPGIYLI